MVGLVHSFVGNVAKYFESLSVLNVVLSQRADQAGDQLVVASQPD